LLCAVCCEKHFPTVDARTKKTISEADFIFVR
jgi:hypothetical protein